MSWSNWILPPQHSDSELWDRGFTTTYILETRAENYGQLLQLLPALWTLLLVFALFCAETFEAVT